MSRLSRRMAERVSHEVAHGFVHQIIAALTGRGFEGRALRGGPLTTQDSAVLETRPRGVDNKLHKKFRLEAGSLLGGRGAPRRTQADAR